MQKFHTSTLASGIRRAIAIVLAVSMLLIPVNMPGAAAESYENLNGTSGYTQSVKDDVTYQWAGDGNGAFSVSGGKLTLASAGKSAAAWLSATAEDGTNVIPTWGNFNVEVEAFRPSTTAGKANGPALAVKTATGKGFFVEYGVSGTKFEATIFTLNSDGSVTRGAAFQIAADTTRAVKLQLKVNGNTVTPVVYYYSSSTATSMSVTTRTQNNVTLDGAVTDIGLRAHWNDVNTTAVFDNFKVEVGTKVVYEDQFNAEAVDVVYKWATEGNVAVANGMATITSDTSVVEAVLSGTAGNVDVVGSWTDYTVEASVGILNHTRGRRYGAAIMGTTLNGDVYWLVCGPAGSGKAFAVSLYKNGTYAGLEKEFTATSNIDATKPVTLKLAFVGNTVTAYYEYYAKNATTPTKATLGSQTSTGTASGNNKVGMLTNVLVKDVKSSFDYFKVTVGNDQVFYDDFSSNVGFTDTGIVKEDAYTPGGYKVVKEDAYTRWDMSIVAECDNATVTIADYGTSNSVKLYVNGTEQQLTAGKYTVSQMGEYTIKAVDANGKEVEKKILVGHVYDDAGNCTACTYVCPHDELEADDGDCSTPVYCVKCKKVAFAAQEHNGTGNWLTDGTNHYKTCANTCEDGTPCTGRANEAACSGGTGDCVNKPTCTVCGNLYVNDSLHDKEADKWTSDGTNHWHACKREGCNEHLDEAAHTGGTATCLKGKECEVCGKEYTEKDANNHTGTSEWDNTATEHNKKYNCCGAQDPAFTKEEHHWQNGTCTECGYGCAHTGGEADCKNKAVCEICGVAYGNLGDHKWATEWSTDGTNHWHECTVGGCTEVKDKTAHTPNADDGDCTTAITCSVCNAVTTEARDSHTGGTATCQEKAECIICHKKYGEIGGHSGGTATCTQKATCSVCNQIYGEVSARNHTKAAEWVIKEDTHKQIFACCGAIAIEEGAHIVGEATCTEKALCTVCGKEYGELNPNKHSKEEKWVIDAGKHSKAYECCGKVTMQAEPHTGGASTCTDSAKCTVCGGSYGRLNPENHTKDIKWVADGEYHTKAYECCGKAVYAKEEHKWDGYYCTVCEYEMEVGSIGRPIEIKGESGTVVVEYELESKEKLYFELDESLAGKIISVKGQKSIVVADGAKYEAPKDMVEFKLPKKYAKISLNLQNNDTVTRSYIITISISDESNSVTGDNAQIMLFGSLLVMSVLAGGVLLMPSIRKKLLNQ